MKAFSPYFSELGALKVYDEKTAKAGTFYRQRRRWLASQHSILKKGLRDLPHAILHRHTDYCNKIVQWLIAVNAFQEYDRILQAALKVKKSVLFLLALGPTATILAYDLCKAGVQAIDIGRVDVEYEWFCMKTTRKR